MTCDDDRLHSLVARSQAGERDVLVEILDILQEDLRTIIERRRLQEADREDAGQQAVVLVMHCVRSYDASMGSFRAYACSSVRHMLRGFWRPRWLELDQIPEPVVESCEAEALCRAEVEERLARSPHADVVRLYFGIGCEPMTLNQIGAMVGRSPETVRRSLAEALEAMRGGG